MSLRPANSILSRYRARRFCPGRTAFWSALSHRILLLAVNFSIASVMFMSSAAAQVAAPNAEFEDFANRALATFGLVAVANDTASFLSVTKGGGDESSFRSSQLGGGFVWSNDIPLYLEGYLGFQRYDPHFILDKPTRDLDVRANWYGLAATGGIGWDFRLSGHWSFRPIVNVSIGKITSEANIQAPIVASDSGGDLDFLTNGHITAGGLGGTLMLEYQNHQKSYDLDIRLRHSYLHLTSIGSSADISASADAITTTGWVRARIPVSGWKAFGNPVRSVWQASVTSYSGDQGEVLGIKWLAKVGAGIELDTENTELPLVKRARLLVSYAFNDDYSGYSLGIGFNF